MYKIYQVGYGDTLKSIADMVGTTVDELNTINGFDGREVMMGDLIIVPNMNKDNTMFTKYLIKNGDTLYMIAKNYNVDPKILAILNGLDMDDYIYPNQEIMVPSDNIDMYITKNGDTIKTILDNFNTTFDNLENDNKNIYLQENQIIIRKRDNY